ncbi:phytoene desaturase family protein [Marinivivus vitaminiproducens]|uniref:phytoene desaturase family protein n=1 Tax=Marinivivus vitaminiproducens TaxID=3035935 RepID=UPI0027A7FD5B|nr:phytoene desaturase family protein [Geminicoccaceae bacterium SCSIO 64248]
MPSADIAIIGAGPGGLAASLLLAHAGARVTVYERHARVGGRSAAIEADGFRFDTGPTFFLYPRILEEIFASVGRRLRDEVEMIQLDPQYHIHFEQGGEIRATPDRERMRAEIRRMAPADAERFDLYMADNRRKLEVFEPILQMPFHGPSALFDRRMLQALPHLRPTRTVDTDLFRFFQDPRVRLAFTFQSKYLGMSPFQCPSLFTILSFLEHEYGVWHPKGGCSAVMEAMARIAREMGVRFELGTPVRELMFTGRRATGVVTDQGRQHVDAVVINADFANAMIHLVPETLRARWTNRRLENCKYSCSTFMLYLGIEGSYPELEHHTIWLARDYARNIEEIQNGKTLFENPSFYVQNACRTDPGLAPEGCSTLYVLVPVAHETPHIDWSVLAPRYREIALGQLPKIGITDVEKRIRVERMLTPMSWRTDLSIHKGATFNLAHSLDQMLHRRPRNRFEDLDGVYLVGGGTHPGSGLPVIFEGARVTTRLINEDLGLSSPAAEAAE